MTLRKKQVFLILALLLVALLIGKLVANRDALPSAQPESNQRLPLSPRTDSISQPTTAADSALPGTEREAGTRKSLSDSAERTGLPYTAQCPPGTVAVKITKMRRGQSWDKTLNKINTQLAACHDWFDTVGVLSAWLYQNTRVGNNSLHGAERVIGGRYVLTRLDIQYLHGLSNSDTVTGDCSFHAYYALIFYDFFGIRSYCYSLRSNPRGKKRGEGHMFNILYNPHDGRWYAADHFFGIRYRHGDAWLDMEKYFQLARQQRLEEVSVDTFGAFKFRIHDSPCVPLEAWRLDAAEIAGAEPGNHPGHYRILAPYALWQHFPQFKEIFDPIAATYDQPPHAGWMDLALRMPFYGARIFPLADLKEQMHADSLLRAWRED